MATNNSSNLKVTNNADGFDVAGGTTARKLTVSGGDVSVVGSGSATLTFPSTTDTLVGRDTTDTLTNKTLTSPTLTTPALGTPASGTLTNCSGLPVNGIVDDTTSALGVGTLELGHASDTTLSRSAAGVLAVEGTAIPKGTGTSNEIAYWSGTNTVGTLAVATYPSLTELSYVKGVTSAIQTQIGEKAPTASPTFTGTVTLPTGLTGLLRADTGVVSVDTDVTDLVSAASDTVAGKVELAIASEVNTGTDATRAVTPDALAGSNLGTKNISVQVVDGATALATGNGKAYLRIPAELNGMNIVGVAAQVIVKSTSGNPTFMIERGRQAAPTSDFTYVDVLSTAITIDANEYDSKDAATAAAINTSNDDLATGDVLRIDVDGAGTGTKGLQVTISCRLP